MNNQLRQRVLGGMLRGDLFSKIHEMLNYCAEEKSSAGNAAGGQHRNELDTKIGQVEHARPWARRGASRPSRFRKNFCLAERGIPPACSGFCSSTA